MGTKYPDFRAAFLNGMPLGVLFAGFLFAFLGVTLNALLKAAKRNPMSDKSPIEFSAKFFWSDNVKRFAISAATTVIVIFLSLRFFRELAGTSGELSMLYCLGVGLGLDAAIAKLINKSKS